MRRDFSWVYGASSQEIENQLAPQDENEPINKGSIDFSGVKIATPNTRYDAGADPSAVGGDGSVEGAIDFGGVKIAKPNTRYDPNLDPAKPKVYEKGSGAYTQGKKTIVGDIPITWDMENGRIPSLYDVGVSAAKEWLWKPLPKEGEEITFADNLRARTMISIAGARFTDKGFASNTLWDIPEDMRTEMLTEAHSVAGRAGDENGFVENIASSFGGYMVARNNPITAPVEAIVEGYMLWGIGKTMFGISSILTGGFSKIVNMAPIATAVGYSGIGQAVAAAGEKAVYGVKLLGIPFNHAKAFMGFIADTAAFVAANAGIKRYEADNYLFDKVYDLYKEMGIPEYVPSKEEFVHDETVNAITEALIISGIHGGLGLFKFRSRQWISQKEMYEMHDVENVRAGVYELNKHTTKPESVENTYSVAVAEHNNNVTVYSDKTKDYKQSIASVMPVPTTLEGASISGEPIPKATDTILFLPKPTIAEKLPDMLSEKISDKTSGEDYHIGTKDGVMRVVSSEGAVPSKYLDDSRFTPGVERQRPGIIDKPFARDMVDVTPKTPSTPTDPYTPMPSPRVRETLDDIDLEYKVRAQEAKTQDTTYIDNLIEEYLENVAPLETPEQSFARDEAGKQQAKEITAETKKKVEETKPIYDADTETNWDWVYDFDKKTLTIKPKKQKVSGLIEGEKNKPLMIEGRKDLVLLDRDLKRIEKEKQKRLAKEARDKSRADRKAEKDKEPKRGKLMRKKLEKISAFVLELQKLSDQYVKLVSTAKHPDLVLPEVTPQYFYALRVTIENISKLINMASKNSLVINSEDLAGLMASLELLQPHLQNLNFPPEAFDKAMALLKSIGEEAQKIMDAKGVGEMTLPTQLENMNKFAARLQHAEITYNNYMKKIEKGLDSLLDPRILTGDIRELINTVDELLQVFGESRYNNPLGSEVWDYSIQDFYNKLTYHKYYLQDVLAFKIADENMRGVINTPDVNHKQLFVDNMVKAVLAKEVPTLDMDDFIGYFKIEPHPDNPNIYVFNAANPAYIFSNEDDIADAFNEIFKGVMEGLKERGINPSRFMVDTAKRYINNSSAFTKDAQGKLFYAVSKMSDAEIKLVKEIRKTPEFNKALYDYLHSGKLSPDYQHNSVVQKLGDNYKKAIGDQLGDLHRHGLAVSKLEGRLSQQHNPDKVLANKKQWVDAHMDALDWTSVEAVHPHLREVPGETHEDLLNKRRAYLDATAEEIISTKDGMFMGGSGLSLRHVHQRRVFKYKDFDSHMAINEQFGSGGSDVLTMMLNTIQGTAQTLAQSKMFGTKPQMIASTIKEALRIERVAFLEDVTKKGKGGALKKLAKDIKNAFSKQAQEIGIAHNFVDEVLNGNGSTERLHGINKALQSWRQVVTSFSLKNVFKWVFTEPAQLLLAEREYGLAGDQSLFAGLIEAYKQFFQSMLAPDMQMAELGVGLDSVVTAEAGSAMTAELAQMGTIIELDNIGFSKVQANDGAVYDWAEGFSKVMMKATGATALFEKTSRNATINFQSHLREQINNSWDDLPEAFRTFLSRNNINRAEWEKLRSFVNKLGGQIISERFVSPEQLGLNLPMSYISPNLIEALARATLEGTELDVMISIARKLQEAQAKYHGLATLKGDPLVSKIMRPNINITSANQYLGFATQSMYIASEYLHGWQHNYRLQTSMGSEGESGMWGRYVAMMAFPTLLMFIIFRAMKGEKPEATADYTAGIMLETALGVTGNAGIEWALKTAREMGMEGNSLPSAIMSAGSRAIDPAIMFPAQVGDKLNKIRAAEDTAERMLYSNELVSMFTPAWSDTFVKRLILDNIFTMIDSDSAHTAFLLMKKKDVQNNISRWLEPGALTKTPLSKYEMEMIEKERAYKND